MSKPTVLKGKAIVIKDSNGEGIDDIDTDMIFHNKHLHITDINEMGQFAFGNLPGWEKIGSIVTGNDILIVGKNFGSGSSRQQGRRDLLGRSPSQRPGPFPAHLCPR